MKENEKIYNQKGIASGNESSVYKNSEKYVMQKKLATER